jgi:LemA protein
MNRWILIAAAVALLAIALRNRLVRRRLQVDNAYGSIEAMLKKRHDLIPNLVSAVRVYMRHEEGLLERITELRARAASTALPADRRPVVEAELSQALSGLMVAVENYPELRSNENVLQLQAALNEVEEQISAAQLRGHRLQYIPPRVSLEPRCRRPPPRARTDLHHGGG